MGIARTPLTPFGVTLIGRIFVVLRILKIKSIPICKTDKFKLRSEQSHLPLEIRICVEKKERMKLA